MLSTSFIPAGSQIFNTYADPPNSDLLRRYGHVDDENSADLVEIGLESVVDLIGEATGLDEQEREVRAEWLLEVGIEEYVQPLALSADWFSTFSLDTSHVLPEEFISAIRTFVATPAEFAKAQAKESAPRGKLDSQVAEWARKLIAGREAQYPTTIAVRPSRFLLVPDRSDALAGGRATPAVDPVASADNAASHGPHRALEREADPRRHAREARAGLASWTSAPCHDRQEEAQGGRLVLEQKAVQDCSLIDGEAGTACMECTTLLYTLSRGSRLAPSRSVSGS